MGLFGGKDLGIDENLMGKLVLPWTFSYAMSSSELFLFFIVASLSQLLNRHLSMVTAAA